MTTRALQTTKFELIRWFVPDLLTCVYWYTLSGCGPATIFRLSVQDVMFSTLTGQKQKSFLEWQELQFQFASMRATTSEFSTSARARLNVLRIERRCRQLSSQAPWTLRRPQNSQPLRRRRSPSVQGPKFIDIDLFFNGKDLPIVNRIGGKKWEIMFKCPSKT